MKLYVYPAVLSCEDDEYIITIPDLSLRNIANSSEEAFLKAKESLKAYFDLAKRFESVVPFPSTYEQICRKNPKKKVVMLDVAVNEDSVQMTEFDSDYNKFMKLFFDED